MQTLAIIGDPIKQVKSPATFGKYFKNHAIDAVLVPLHVTSVNFRSVLAGLRAVRNFAGVVVTIPHKGDAYEIAHTRGPMAAATGMANVLVPTGTDQWAAEMFDGIGLVTALRRRDLDVEGMRTLVIGAGGAGTAIAVALERLGLVGSIGVTDPDRIRAQNLVEKLGNAHVIHPDPGGYQLVINASPVGMGSDETPLGAGQYTEGTIVCDAIMDPSRTRFLRDAERSGCVIVEGLEMLNGQIEPLVRFFGLTASPA